MNIGKDLFVQLLIQMMVFLFWAFGCVLSVGAAPGHITTVAGGGVGDGGAAVSARLTTLLGIFVDGSSNVYIADRDENRVRKMDASGTISTVAGNGAWGYSGDGGPATDASLFLPTGVFVDGSGVLYIADTGNRRLC